MQALQPTALESELLDAFHVLYANEGFPQPREILLLDRTNTGAGRYVDLSSSGAVISRDGYFDLGGRYIEMTGVPNGMMAVVLVSKGKPETLEIAAYGGCGWDGIEQPWVLK